LTQKIISKLRVIILLNFLICSLSSQTRLLYHSPPPFAEVGKALKLKASSFEIIDPIDATLYYRLPGSKSFLEIPFIDSGINWEATVPGFAVTKEGLEYAIIFQFSKDRLVSFPREDPYNNPYFIIAVPPKINELRQVKSKPNEDILILSPEPNALVDQKSILIAASFFNASKVDISSVQLLIDNINVSNSILVEDNILSYDPGELSVGIHSIELLIKDLDGNDINPLNWKFTVGQERAELVDLIKYDGKIKSRLSSEKLSGNSLNIAEIVGDLKIDVQWAKLNTDMRLTSRESPYSQPHNRFGTAFSFGNIININLGDFYPQLSRFTIDGKRVRGIGMNVDLKWLKVQFINGELNRVVQERDVINGGYNILHDQTSTNEDGSKSYYLDRTGFTFRRNVTGLRISTNLFSKINAGVHLIKTRDDTTSVNKVINDATFLSDSLVKGVPIGIYTIDEFKNAISISGNKLNTPTNNWYGQKPQDNLVLGFNIGTILDNRKLTIDFDWNLSLYNRDIWDGPMSISKLDTALDDSLDGFIGVAYDKDGKELSGTTKIRTEDIIFDPENFQSMFIINTSMTPLVPIDINSLKSNPIAAIINMPSSAFRIKLKGNYSRNSILAEYLQVGPEYISLANPFLRSNTRQFTISDRISLLQQKLFINVGFKHLDNKILKTTVSPLNTNTLFMNLTFLLGPNMPTFVLNFQSIGKNNEKTKLDSVGSRTVDLREDSKASTSMLAFSVPFTSGNLKQSITLNIGNATNIDNLNNKRSSSYLFSKTDSKTISVSLSSLFPNQLKTVSLFSQTKLEIPSMVNKELIKTPYTWTHLSFSANKMIFQDKINSKGVITFLNSKSQISSKLLGLRAGFDYRLQENLTASMMSQVRFNYFPDFKEDNLDNDGDGKIDNSGEAFNINSIGIIFNVQYNF